MGRHLSLSSQHCELETTTYVEGPLRHIDHCSGDRMHDYTRRNSVASKGKSPNIFAYRNVDILSVCVHGIIMILLFSMCVCVLPNRSEVRPGFRVELQSRAGLYGSST